MMIKRNLVTMFVLILITFFSGVAFTVAVSSETVKASASLYFHPFIYLIALLCALLLCLAIVALVVWVQFRARRKLIGNGLYSLRDSAASLNEAGVFDYRQIETPEELTGKYSGQSDLAVEEVIKRLVEQAEQNNSDRKSTYVPRHRRVSIENTGSTALVPCLRLIPEMEHTQNGSMDALPDLVDVPQELESLLRKIS